MPGATTPPPQDRRGFFRALRDWAAEETRALAEPFVDDFAERAEPFLAAVSGPELVRPPGALDEEPFLATCEKCHRCIGACPEHSILPAAARDFPEVAATPVILPRRHACYACDPFHCIEACPTGALAPITHTAMKMGVAHVLTALCLAHSGQACEVCHRLCPHRGKAIEMRRGLPVVHPESCTGCGLCEFACPPHPAAIRIVTTR